MAASIDAQDLRAAWRALDGCRDGEGWRTITVSTGAQCSILAGRRLPGNEEALLVGFQDAASPPERQLPQGHGFEVGRVAGGIAGSSRVWLALAKRVGGSTELFAMMADDVLHLLQQATARSGDTLLLLFLSRIRAWQDFMDRHKEGVLSSEAELGLFGELTVLSEILSAGAQPEGALDAWQGPLDGLHDFMPGSGSIEVKTTLSTGNFPAIISSLDQLDDRLRQPLFLAAVRLALDSVGVSLPELADKVRSQVSGCTPAIDILDVRLIQAGLLPTALDRYSRRFRHESTTVLPVQEGFPRLTRSDVHPAIREARYNLHVDLAAAGDVGVVRALELLGVI
jgi:hypothetical protein